MRALRERRDLETINGFARNTTLWPAAKRVQEPVVRGNGGIELYTAPVRAHGFKSRDILGDCMVLLLLLLSL